MNKVDVAGLKISSITKKELLNQVEQRILNGQKTFISTPYSEFLYRCLRDTSLLNFLNQADFAVADGIGIFWAKKYLSLPVTAKSYWGKIFQSYWQAFYSLLAILFYPNWIKSALPEKIVGADLVWDFAKLASDKNLSVYLLGGFGNTPELAKQKLISKYPNIQISTSNKNPADLSIVDEANNSKADILFVAFGPITQEKWIVDNLSHLNVKLAIGVGGSFDYIAGIKTAPPKFIRYSGLEWLWRLVTQPTRVKRIWQATFGLVGKLSHYKVWASYPLRPNAVSVILDKENKIFLGRKFSTRVDIIENRDPEKWKNYWQMPQGGVEPGENFVSACIREAEEETGMTNLTHLYTSTHTHTYFWNNALRKYSDNKKYLFKGQSQQIIYFKFNGDANSIKLPANEEFTEYQWVTLENLNKIIAQEKLPLAKIVQQDFAEVSIHNAE